MDECDKGEEMNPMNRSQIMVKKFLDFFFTPTELYSGLKNTATMKSPNA